MSVPAGDRVTQGEPEGSQGPRQRKDKASDRRRARNELAASVASDFLPGTERDLDEERVGATLDSASRWSIPLADVSASIERYLEQERLLARYERPVPSIPVHGEVPLPADVLPAFALSSSRRAMDEGDLIAIERGRERLGLSLERVGLSIVDLAPGDARSAVRERLGQFLETRLVAMEQGGRLLRRLTGVIGGRPPSASPASPGLPFKVTTQMPGLRIHWSPAYFFEPEHVFGFGLSTPVDGWLGPGRYIFGAVGPRLELTFEFGATYDLPDAKMAPMVKV
jgi:hypothetical protein